MDFKSLFKKSSGGCSYPLSRGFGLIDFLIIAFLVDVLIFIVIANIIAYNH